MEEVTPEEMTNDDSLRQPISWQAAEGAYSKKTLTWYVFFVVVVVGLMALAILLFKSWTFAILIPIMAAAVIMLSSRPPKIITYSVSPKGVYVADKLFDFSEFRAFGVIQDQEIASIMLLPVKRFSPGVTIYFDEKDGERIVDMLGARLPIQEVKSDSLEKLIRLIGL